jgi:hypothetical protein
MGDASFLLIALRLMEAFLAHFSGPIRQNILHPRTDFKTHSKGC